MLCFENARLQNSSSGTSDRQASERSTAPPRAEGAARANRPPPPPGWLPRATPAGDAGRRRLSGGSRGSNGRSAEAGSQSALAGREPLLDDASASPAAEPSRAWPPPLTGAGSQTPELGAGTFGGPGPLRPGPFRPLLGQSHYSVPWGPRLFRARARRASSSPLAARLRFLKNP